MTFKQLVSVSAFLGLTGFTTAVQGLENNAAVPRDDFPTIPKKARRRVFKEQAPTRRLKKGKKGDRDFSYAYQNSITSGGMYEHLAALQMIGDEHDGHRSAGSAGYEESVEYVTSKLEAAGYDVWYSETHFDYFEVVSPPVIEAPAGVDYTSPGNDPDTYYVFPGSDSGSVTAPVTAVNVNYDPDSDPNTSTSGCDPAEFEGFPAGNIALLQRGTCFFVTKYQNAVDAGASAVILTNEGNNMAGRTEAFSFSGGGNNYGVPTLFSSSMLGMSLMDAMSSGEVVLTITTDVINEVRTDMSIIAETSSGDEDNVVMVGAHLDSVPAGPGIDDDGSGVTAVLEMALQIKENGWDTKKVLENKIRFGFWACEEIGLLGSQQYVDALSDEEVNKIALYVNLDMIASTNYVRWIEDGDGSEGEHDLPLHEGMAEIEALFLEWFDEKGLPVTSNPLPFLIGRSDHTAFHDAGIPIGFATTGASSLKTEEEYAKFGGLLGEALDPCYHQACDRIDNVHFGVMEEMARATTHVIAMTATMKM